MRTHRLAAWLLVAAGVLGQKSYEQGVTSAALGVVLHFFIAFVASAIYYAASRIIPLLKARAVLSGILYGALVYVFMHVVVLPLSALPQSHVPVIYKVCEFVEHWFCVGLPISLAVRHYSS